MKQEYGTKRNNNYFLKRKKNNFLSIYLPRTSPATAKYSAACQKGAIIEFINSENLFT